MENKNLLKQAEKRTNTFTGRAAADENDHTVCAGNRAAQCPPVPVAEAR